MRNPEREFVSTDTASLIQEMSLSYESLSGEILTPGSPEMLMLRWVASIIAQERAKLNYAANQNLPSRAEGDNLDALAEMFYTAKRKAAQPAVCVMRFHISQAQANSILIPSGTRVTDGGQRLYWETLADAYVPIGETYADVTIQCQTAGTAGNGWTAGAINAVVDLYDYYSGCENITESGGGADEQTDDELYEAMIASLQAPSTAGARGSYIYHAKSVSTEIADVAVTSPAPGEVRIYALMKDGSIAGETVKQAIYEICNAEDVRPLTDHLEINDPNIIRYAIRLTYWLPSGTQNAAAVEAAVKEAVQSYVSWQGAKLGRDINPSALIANIMKTGVKRVDVESPVFTKIERGSDNATPAVALVESVILTNGGFEDE